jgi:hypothetical protein
MHKNATKCNKTQSKWCINKHGTSKIIDTFETYQAHDEPPDDLGRTIADARRECKTNKEGEKLDRMLDDHKKSLYPKYQNGLKKLGSTLELLKWKA